MDKVLAETGKIFTTQNPDGTFSFIGNWFTYANLTLSTGLFGFTFLIACILTAAYYVLVVVTEPTQQRRISEHFASQLQDWNFERVLHLIYFAYTTYTTLDLADVTCQSKIICELQETEGDVGKATERISNFLLFFDAFDTVPNISEYRNAARRGQRRNGFGRSSNITEELKDDICDSSYSSCKFSVHRFNQQFYSVFGSTGDSPFFPHRIHKLG